MTFEKPQNPNYCATVVELRSFVDLPNCDNVKAALIFGNSVIVGKDTAARFLKPSTDSTRACSPNGVR